MLIEFRVENHRSLRDEQVFTMEAGRSSGVEDPHVRAVEGHKVPLITAAALYGANASGKSNVLSALAYMCDAVKSSHRYWDPEGGVPRDPFAWGDKKREPSLFEVTFLSSGTKHRYGFVVDDERVLEEWLFAWPSARKQVWFERETSVRFGENLKGENRLIEDVTRPNALLLSVAAQHGHKQLAEIYQWFAKVRFDNVSAPHRVQLANISRLIRALSEPLDAASLASYMAKPAGSLKVHRKESDFAESWNSGLKQLVTAADVGIVDAKLIESKDRAGVLAPEVHFRHKSDAEDAWLPLSEESTGTQQLFRMAKSLLRTLEQGELLVVDELERSLHPLLGLQLLKQFSGKSSNPNGAQLIFSTHDTNLLGTTFGEPALARDQVWLTEKNDSGATVIYPLTDYKPRKAENIERGYLQGRYGAIPFLGDFEKLVD